MVVVVVIVVTVVVAAAAASSLNESGMQFVPLVYNILLKYSALGRFCTIESNA